MIYIYMIYIWYIYIYLIDDIYIYDIYIWYILYIFDIYDIYIWYMIYMYIWYIWYIYIWYIYIYDIYLIYIYIYICMIYIIYIFIYIYIIYKYNIIYMIFIYIYDIGWADYIRNSPAYIWVLWCYVWAIEPFVSGIRIQQNARQNMPDNMSEFISGRLCVGITERKLFFMAHCGVFSQTRTLP